MAGLEALYTCVASSITSPQDAVVCFIHWEIVKSGYKCLGTGDEPLNGEKKSELLPASWNTNKELYTLRYRSNDDKSNLLLKAITVDDSSLIFNLMDSASDKITDLTITVSDYVNEANLQSFESLYKNIGDLAKRLNSSLLPAVKDQGSVMNKRRERFTDTEPIPDHDPLSVPTGHPSASCPPDWTDPLNPFAAGRADLDPLSGSAEGMIVDPLHAGFPCPGFDPSSGTPGDLPPGSVYPRARFDPILPFGRQRAGPDPDHLPRPGYDDTV
ncbi:proteasome inhibitor PI31 subunit-like [Tachysurus fulvidraco]|uniref:proteasome inhibitor PI31 subunit-like n=1 Tax=Tachysurus fulvidraco TaxID=1234273 RepID=UPI001FED7815|nr:proteasome inhibitor PI31 subunit-like [Tachysurus fulvidraco]